MEEIFAKGFVGFTSVARRRGFRHSRAFFPPSTLLCVPFPPFSILFYLCEIIRTLSPFSLSFPAFPLFPPFPAFPPNFALPLPLLLLTNLTYNTKPKQKFKGTKIHVSKSFPAPTFWSPLSLSRILFFHPPHRTAPL